MNYSRPANDYQPATLTAPRGSGNQDIVSDTMNSHISQGNETAEQESEDLALSRGKDRFVPSYAPGDADTLMVGSGDIKFNSNKKRTSDYMGVDNNTPIPYTKPYEQPYGFVGQPYGTSPEQALEEYQERDDTRSDKKRSIIDTDRVTMARSGGFDPRVIPASNPVAPSNLKVQKGQFGYEANEMAGIYGFGFGTSKELLGFGDSNNVPDKPVLQSASRAYGSERSFWDLNLGGLGDFPTPLRGEYGNIEFSEITRRFIPHRRRDIDELNPIPNQFANKYPWLPGSDYFTNFDIGDPYVSIPEGEMRLPGPGYEKTHKLHPDETGEYGLLDKHRILSDVAPWSEQYKTVDQILRKSDLSPDDKEFAQTTRDQIAEVKKRHNFKPYKYAHSDFQKADVKVTGFMPGDADHLITDGGIIKLAGVRSRKTPEAMNLAQSLIKPGDTVSLMYDANASVLKSMPVEATVTTQKGEDLGKSLLDADQGYYSKKNDALDNRVREGAFEFDKNVLKETLQHANTVINQKASPNRSPVEDWERNHIYGTDFPQWNHPIQDFIEPLGHRASNRNPVYATAVLSVVGRAFGKTAQGKTAGAIIGGLTGFALSMTSNAKTMETGQRHIPKRRQQELALDEYADMLNYVKYTSLYTGQRQKAIDTEGSDPEKYARAVEEGKYKEHQFTNLGPDTVTALQYRKKARQTEYGADLFGSIMDESAALPKRKRDYFIPFINSPENEHARILSTAPRLERRMYEARWGMAIEDKPDLPDYFSKHELPNKNWEGWSPDVSMDNVELKMIQQQGLEASQMGYYPQQVKQANLLNPQYPDYNQHENHAAAAAQLQSMMNNAGLNGSVTMRRTNQPGKSINLQMGLQGG